jgi:NAD(P)-dependent dehydrogenase (short-subunit alcohol dehydrogenase family)
MSTMNSATTNERFLDGHHAVITGGARGIGAAIAGALASKGAFVSLFGRDAGALEERRDAILANGGDAFAHVVNVRDDEAIAQGMAAARETFGHIHILVNNAGVAAGGSFTDIDRQAWDRILAVNLTAAFVCSQHVLPDMIAARHGRIINVASTAGLRGVPRIAPYVASKHGLVGLTRALAVEYAKSGITVNAVCPGYVDTGMAQQAVDAVMAGTGRSAEEARQAISRPSVFNRLLEPEEVARIVAWLCSADAATITGQAIVIGGDVI